MERDKAYEDWINSLLHIKPTASQQFWLRQMWNVIWEIVKEVKNGS